MTRSLLFLLLLFFAVVTSGQTPFTLTVKGLQNAHQISLHKGDSVLKDGSTIYLDSTRKWSIFVTSGNRGLKIPKCILKIENSTFGGETLAPILIANDTTIKVSNDTVEGTKFVFGNNFNITVQQPDHNNTTVASFKKLGLQEPDGTKPTLTNTPGIGAHKTSSALYDALFLNGNGSLDDKKKVLAVYCNIPASAPDVVGKLDSALKTNLFLADYWKKLKDSITSRVGAQTNIPLLASMGSAVGGLNVTSLADGLAQFLIKRAKQELAMAYFDKLQQILGDSTHFKDLYTVFPQTYQTIKVMGTEIYNYQNYLQSLRSSFEKDLSNLPSNLPSIIDNHESFFKQPDHAYLAASLRSGCYIAAELKDGSHPGDILQNYPTDYLESLKPAWKGSIQTIQLLSLSLKDTAGTKDSTYWVSGAKVKQLVNDSTAFKLYVGLILQQATYFDKNENNTMPIKFSATATLPALLNSVAASYGPLRSYLTQVIAKANTLDGMIKSYTRSSSDSLKIEQYSAYFKTFVDLLQQGAKITVVPAFSKLLPATAETKMDTYFDVAQTTSDLVLEVNRRQYSSAIVSVTHIYDVIQAGKDTSIQTNSVIVKVSSKKATKRLTTATMAGIASINKKLDSLTARPNLTAGDTAALTAISKSTAMLKDSLTTITEKVNTVNETIVSANTKSYLLKYGSFMAAMVLTKSSSDVENTIESFALPPGSSRIKRESVFNVSLNGYAGLYYGHEKISGIKDGLFFNSYGVTAPVGIALSWGHRLIFGTGDGGWKTGKKGWSTSVFFSLIDLGAIAAYRINNDSVQQVPNIQLKDIFSPGAFLSIGIPKSPLSLNFGAQLGPNLRKVDNAKNDYVGKTYVRYSASILVDIPVLNFYTKPKE